MIRAGLLRGLEGGDADEDVVRMRVVAGSVAVGDYRAVQHERVRRRGHLRNITITAKNGVKYSILRL